VYEGADDTLTAVFEVPGYTKNDISIELHNDQLTVSGDLKKTLSGPETPSENQDAGQVQRRETPKGPTYYVRERRTGKFERTIIVPEGTKVIPICSAVCE
jgi:HSP20 family protein